MSNFVKNLSMHMNMFMQNENFKSGKIVYDEMIKHYKHKMDEKRIMTQKIKMME